MVEHQCAVDVVADSLVVRHEAEEEDSALAAAEVVVSPVVAAADSRGEAEHQEDVAHQEEGAIRIINLRVRGIMGVLVTCLFQGSVYNNHSCHRGLASVMSKTHY